MVTINKKDLATGSALFLCAFLIRLLFVFTIPYDSDEITWSIIGRRVLAGEDFHIFFLNQKYMGAIEGYIVGIFQALFGYNIITLRINSLIFSSILAVAIFYIIKKFASSKYALVGFALFNLASYDVTSNYTKAWANRPFASLIGLLVVYATWILFLNNKIEDKKRAYLSCLTGLLLGLSFWADLENVYFIVIAFGVVFLGLLDIPKIVRFLRNLKIPKPSPKTAISLLFFFLLFWLLYMIFTKKALFNPYETLLVKLGLNERALSFLNYSFETQFFLLLFYIVAPIKLLLFPEKNKKLLSFSLLWTFFMVGAYFSISRGSVSRANDISNTYKEQVDFWISPILSLFLGIRTIPLDTSIRGILTYLSVLLLPLIATSWTIKKSVLSLVKTSRLRISLPDIFALYVLIPILFVASRVGSINSSSRYITNLWPGFVILYVYGIYIMRSKRNLLLKILPLLLLLFFVYRNYQIYPNALKDLQALTYTNEDFVNAANYLMSKDIKGCYAGYWNAYPIMWESDYKVICSPSPYFGYGEDETPFNTLFVDKIDNPAFVFTTQKRVDEFYTRWVGKEVSILDQARIGRYYIFLTNRL